MSCVLWSPGYNMALRRSPRLSYNLSSVGWGWVTAGGSCWAWQCLRAKPRARWESSPGEQESGSFHLDPSSKYTGMWQIAGLGLRSWIRRWRSQQWFFMDREWAPQVRMDQRAAHELWKQDSFRQVARNVHSMKRSGFTLFTFYFHCVLPYLTKPVGRLFKRGPECK